MDFCSQNLSSFSAFKRNSFLPMSCVIFVPIPEIDSRFFFGVSQTAFAEPFIWISFLKLVLPMFLHCLSARI